MTERDDAYGDGNPTEQPRRATPVMPGVRDLAPATGRPGGRRPGRRTLPTTYPRMLVLRRDRMGTPDVHNRGATVRLHTHHRSYRMTHRTFITPPLPPERPAAPAAKHKRPPAEPDTIRACYWALAALGAAMAAVWGAWFALAFAPDLVVYAVALSALVVCLIAILASIEAIEQLGDERRRQRQAAAPCHWCGK